MKYKNFIVFKDHLVPNVFKDSVTNIKQFLMLKNNASRQVVNQMFHHIDRAQQRKLRSQFNQYKIKQKQQINVKMKKYLNPLHHCPQYFSMLVNQIKTSHNQQHLKLCQMQNSQNIKPKNIHMKSIIHSKLIKATLNIHPAKKVKIYQNFKLEYKKYKLSNPELINLLTQSTVFYIPPMLYTMPIQIFQIQNPDLDFDKCKQIYSLNSNIEKKYSSKLNEYIQFHKKELQYICIKCGLTIKQLLFQYQTQLDKEEQIKVYMQG